MAAPSTTSAEVANSAKEQKPARPKKKGPKLAEIHARPLPLDVHPLPAFHPSNPVSLLRLVYTWISDVLFPPTSHPANSLVGYFSPETRSVHVTDPGCARVLWQMGFFGKGTLSRSEPSWLDREKARLLEESADPAGRKLAAEEWTRARREERRLFKLERARLEAEKIERQRLMEEGKLDPDDLVPADLVAAAIDDLAIKADDGDEFENGAEPKSLQRPHIDISSQNGDINGAPKLPLSSAMDQTLPPPPDNLPSPLSTRQIINDLPPAQPRDNNGADESRGRQLKNEEHLQLTLEEAFFLSYGLGVLSIHPARRRDPSPLSTKTTIQPYTNADLLELFCQYSSFPPADAIWITPDDQFLLNYVAYHHFRSLGWVVRPGQKFAVDYLLYNRGPVFSHAEFAVLIIPAYRDRYWNTPGGRARRRVWQPMDWWSLHGVNRVQSRVFKTLVLCYIDIPSELDLDFDEEIDVGKLLRSFSVREVIVKRWLPNRSR